MIWFLPWIARRQFDRQSTTLPVRFRKQHQRGLKHAAWIWTFFAAVPIAVPIVFSQAVTPTIPLLAALGATLFHLSLYAAILGCAFIASALTSRRGSFIVCAKCDYPMGAWRAAPPACPERGKPWKSPWNARIGARRVRPALLAWGGGLVFASFMLVLLGVYFFVRTLLK